MVSVKKLIAIILDFFKNLFRLFVFSFFVFPKTIFLFLVVSVNVCMSHTSDATKRSKKRKTPSSSSSKPWQKLVSQFRELRRQFMNELYLDVVGEEMSEVTRKAEVCTEFQDVLEATWEDLTGEEHVKLKRMMKSAQASQRQRDHDNRERTKTLRRKRADERQSKKLCVASHRNLFEGFFNLLQHLGNITVFGKFQAPSMIDDDSDVDDSSANSSARSIMGLETAFFDNLFFSTELKCHDIKPKVKARKMLKRSQKSTTSRPLKHGTCVFYRLQVRTKEKRFHILMTLDNPTLWHGRLDEEAEQTKDWETLKWRDGHSIPHRLKESDTSNVFVDSRFLALYLPLCGVSFRFQKDIMRIVAEYFYD
jgi:hypothetical protein